MRRLFWSAAAALLLLGGCGGPAAGPIVRNAVTGKRIAHLPVPVYLPAAGHYSCPIRYQPPARNPAPASASASPGYTPWQVTVYCTQPKTRSMVMITEYGAAITQLGRKVEVGGSLWETAATDATYPVVTLFGPKLSMEIGGRQVTSRLAVVLVGAPGESLRYLEKFAQSLRRTTI